MEITCPHCKKEVRIPDSYQKPKGKCPKCEKTIDFLTIDLPVAPIKTVNFPEYLNDHVLGVKLSEFNHPVIELFKKHKKKLIDYSGAFSTLNDMLKTRKFRRTQYLQKEASLKGKYLSHFIEDIDKLDDFPLENKDKILLWKYLFSFYPYVVFENGKDVVYNLYQRYSLAKIIEAVYFSRHIDSLETRFKLIYFSIQHQRNKVLMEKILEDLKDNNEYDALAQKVHDLFKDNETILTFRDLVDINDLKRIFEDFSVGLNWIRIYLD
ncbi:hypothetical protein ACFL4T_11575 [candidate division KSB1 bacterium]